MLRRTHLFILLTVALATSSALFASEPVIPTSTQWIVTPCDTWTCASDAVMQAAGDRYVVAIPTVSAKYPWIVVRRVLSGSFYIPPDAPFLLESFDGMGEASARFISIADVNGPMLITAVDGKKLVIFLREPEARHRAVNPH